MQSCLMKDCTHPRDKEIADLKKENADLKKENADLKVRWVADAVAGALEDSRDYHRSSLTRRCVP